VCFKVLEFDGNDCDVVCFAWCYMHRTIYNMCTQSPPHDYSQQIYYKYRETFEEYITSMVRNTTCFLAIFFLKWLEEMCVIELLAVEYVWYRIEWLQNRKCSVSCIKSGKTSGFLSSLEATNIFSWILFLCDIGELEFSLLGFILYVFGLVQLWVAKTMVYCPNWNLASPQGKVIT